MNVEEITSQQEDIDRSPLEAKRVAKYMPPRRPTSIFDPYLNLATGAKDLVRDHDRVFNRLVLLADRIETVLHRIGEN
jgi:hypothetical protein